MWLANFTPTPKFVDANGVFNGANPSANEPAWPKRTSECDSRRAFITHRISRTPGSVWWDLGHLGQGNAGSLIGSVGSLGWSVTPDQPVGMADGSINTRKKTMVLPRATSSDGSTTYYY